MLTEDEESEEPSCDHDICISLKHCSIISPMLGQVQISLMADCCCDAIQCHNQGEKHMIPNGLLSKMVDKTALMLYPSFLWRALYEKPQDSLKNKIIEINIEELAPLFLVVLCNVGLKYELFQESTCNTSSHSMLLDPFLTQR